MTRNKSWKPTAVLVLALCLGACGDDPAAPGDPLTQGLEAYYTFASGVGDGSGNGNDGTLLGGATISSGALVTGSNDMDALSLPASLLDGRTNFSLAGWVKMTTFHIWPSQWVSGATASEDNNLGIWYSSDSNSWSMCLFGTTTEFSNNSAMEDTQWHHVVVTRNGSSASLYVDGALVGPAMTVSADPLEVDTGGLIIGQDQDSLGGGFSTDNSLAGEVDELRIYSRAISAADVAALFALGR